jgi:filamentous hemagglutinin
VISGDADPSKNSLATGTLTFSDIQNRSSHDAHSGGFSGGATTGDGGTNYSTHGPSSGKNAGGAAPMLSQDDSGSDSAMTRSGIGAGTINVTDSAHSSQDIASLNRDTSSANHAVAKTPDVNILLNNQTDTMAAASAAGEAVSRRLGDYASTKEKEADDTVAAAAWAEGGSNRAMMQAAGAALVTGLGGGDAIAGTAGAGVASIAAGKLNNLNSAIADPGPSGNASVNETLGNIVANVIATGAGAVVGGDAGAFSAHRVDRFNRQLHPDEKKWINDQESAYAKRYGLTSEQAHHELTTQANLQVQNGSPGQWNQRASDFLSQAHGMLPADGNSGPGYMLYATPAQKAEPSIYARYYPNGERLNQPAAGDVVNSANRDALNRAAYSKATTSAAALAGGIVIAGPIAVLPGTPIFSVGGALGSGAWASPTGTGVISAGISAASQYYQTGTLNWVEVAIAAISGGIGAHGGLGWNVFINSAGGAAGAAINNEVYGKSDSILVGGAISGAGSVIGYGAGKILDVGFGGFLKPTINGNSSWADVGKWAGPSGLNLYGPNNWSTIRSSARDGIGGEAATSLINNLKYELEQE